MLITAKFLKGYMCIIAFKCLKERLDEHVKIGWYICASNIYSVVRQNTPKETYETLFPFRNNHSCAPQLQILHRLQDIFLSNMFKFSFHSVTIILAHF
jgi:hypothetical protein